MQYIYLLLAMCSSASLSIMSTLFGKLNKVKNISGLYSLILTATAFVMWGIICLFEGEFNVSVIKYSILFGMFYTIAMIGMFKAYQTGSVSLTAFVKQLSLIGVAFWGLIFWNNPLGLNVIIGLVLIVIALYLCFRPDNKEVRSVEVAWFFYAMMLLVGNAGCSIVQKYQQLDFDGSFKSLFMLWGAAVAFISSAVLYFSGNRCSFKDINKKTVICPVVGGISSAALNLLILLLIASPLSESVIFPGIAVGGLLLTTIFSVIAYKEKMSAMQWSGLVIGVVALVLLNI